MLLRADKSTTSDVRRVSAPLLEIFYVSITPANGSGKKSVDVLGD